MDVYTAFTNVLPPDLMMHPSFLAEPALRPKGPDLQILFRHSGWLHDRKRVYRALWDLYGDKPRVKRFAECGVNAWVVRKEEDPQQYGIVSDHCHDRFCRPCAAWKGRVIANNIAGVLGDREYRFVTLTIKTTDLTLKEGIDKLYRSFAALRRSRLWAEKVRGGCAVCEIKPKAGGVGWHPHLHLIAQGKYLPLPLIRKLWLNITGDSFIVDVSYGKGAERAAQYVSKYIAKPFDDGTIRQPTRLQEAIVALTGRRLVMTFGTWRGCRLTEYHPDATWIKVCPLGVLANAARKGDADAAELLRHLIDNIATRNFPHPHERAPPAERTD